MSVIRTNEKTVNYVDLRIDIPSSMGAGSWMILHMENKDCVKIDFYTIKNNQAVHISTITENCNNFLIVMQEYAHLKQEGKI